MMDDHAGPFRGILTLNAGSSSVKFSLFTLDPSTDDASAEPRALGAVADIPDAPVLRVRSGGHSESMPAVHSNPIDTILAFIESRFCDVSVVAVSHRVVHGGPDRHHPAVIDETLLADLANYSAFAPLHQPQNLAGIAAARAIFPDALQVACFDTAFHRTQSFVRDTYALPRKYYDQGIRRYGFHGLSYQSIAKQLHATSPELSRGKVAVAHLGSGASMCALENGQSVASTMGFSALDGLPMSTRCGQLDPGLVLHLIRDRDMTVSAVEDLLYNHSGFLGLSGVSSNMMELEASAEREAQDAIEYLVDHVRRELGSLVAALGGLDGLVFTGGIGEHSAHIRRKICDDLGWLGIELDPQANEDMASIVSSSASTRPVLVMPANEEGILARAALDACRGTRPQRKSAAGRFP